MQRKRGHGAVATRVVRPCGWLTERVLVVDLRQPRTVVMLWFELHFGTNPPLGILMI
jgi:hypothetical protein